MKKFLAIAIIASSLVACNEKKTDETTVNADTTMVTPMVDTTVAPMMDTTNTMMADTTVKM